MKTSIIWKSLSLLAMVSVFFAISPLAKSRTLIAQESSTASTEFDRIAVPQAVHTVTIKDMVFDPAELHVKKGDAVIWVNKDIVSHNITQFPDSKWTSGTLADGKSWKKKMDKSFDYFCSIHPTMKGKIVVDE